MAISAAQAAADLATTGSLPSLPPRTQPRNASRCASA
jgi:hypothetical protein